MVLYTDKNVLEIVYYWFCLGFLDLLSIIPQTDKDIPHSPPIAPLGLSMENLGFAPLPERKAALQNLQTDGQSVEPRSDIADSRFYGDNEDTLNFLNKITGKEGTRSLKDLLEKRESDKKKNIFKSGCDERYGNETDRYDIIFNITQFVYQMNLLQKLESSQVSVTDKISAIKQYKKDTSDDEYVAQLKSGGLYKDWNIDL